MAQTKAPKIKQALDPESESWNKLPWRTLEQHVYRIQKRIFKAKEHDNQRAVHKLQKLLMKSRAARLLAVRRVTQDNQGKKTAGIDGVKSVPPRQRLEMVECIHPKHWKNIKAHPVRRIYIPKPGKVEKRPRWYTRDGHESAASTREKRSGTGMGSLLRGQQLWFSPWTLLSRCDPSHLSRYL